MQFKEQLDNFKLHAQPIIQAQHSLDQDYKIHEYVWLIISRLVGQSPILQTMFLPLM